MQLAADTYFQMRARHRAQVHEGAASEMFQDGGPPPERWLQQVWRHQRVQRSGLRLASGEPIRVLHPGFWNREAGQDFRGAVVQFGDEAPRTGDVELDLFTSGWRDHGHAVNAGFRNVILHVVWDEADADKSRPPVIALKPFLDAPLPELATWLDLEAERTLPDNVPGKCSELLRDFTPEQLHELLIQAARLRRERKAAELAARARLIGWDSALWEGMLAALGYKHNAWAFRRLAELAPLPNQSHGAGAISAPPHPTHPIAVEAHFLGLAGLLPHELPRRADPHLGALWDCWWRERDAMQDWILPPSMWRLGGIRPANRPERRLALAAWWRGQTELPVKLDAWIRASAGRAPRQTARELLLLLAPPESDPVPYWTRHWTLRSGVLATPQPLLGQPRVTDLAINVILPWLWARTGAGADRPDLRSVVDACWECWPASEDNAVLRLARQRLFGAVRPRIPTRAVMQQGLLQITRDFCDHAGALCVECQFPKSLREAE